jgi:hypothetical protein
MDKKPRQTAWTQAFLGAAADMYLDEVREETTLDRLEIADEIIKVKRLTKSRTLERLGLQRRYLCPAYRGCKQHCEAKWTSFCTRSKPRQNDNRSNAHSRIRPSHDYNPDTPTRATALERTAPAIWRRLGLEGKSVGKIDG